MFASAERKAERAAAARFADALEREQARRAKAVEKEQARRARRTNGKEDAPDKTPDLITRLALRVPTAVWGALIGAALLLIVAEALHEHAPGLWPLALIVGGACAALLWARLPLSGALPLAWGGALPRRWLAAGAAGIVGIWAAFVWGLGVDRILLFDLVVITLAVVVAAWRGARQPEPKARQTGADPAQIVADWDALVGAPKGALSSVLSGSTAHVHGQDDIGWTLRLDLAAGHTADELHALVRNLESALRLRRGALRVEHHEDAHRVLLRAVRRDLLAKPVPWTEPKGRSVLDPIHLGTFEDGTPCELRLVPEAGRGISAVIAGLPGAGKSGLLNIIIAALAGCHDALLAGIDPQGSELGPWEDVFEPSLFALDAGAEAKAVLERLLAIMGARQRHLTAEGIRYWTPSPEMPEIVLVIDEAADLARHMEMLDEVVRRGRKLGVHVVLATQRPSAKALGDWGSEVISKCGVRICLRVSTVTETNIALSPGAAGEGWRADQLLTRPGEFLVRAADHIAVKRARGLLIRDQDVQRWASACRDSRPRLDEASAAAVEAAGGA